MEKIDAFYTRVSTQMQVKNGDSMENQKTWLVEHAVKNKMSNYQIYADEGFSAKDQKRPALQKLRKDIENGKVKSITVVKLDRLVRSMRDLLELLSFFEDHDIAFKSLRESFDTTTPNGILMLNMLGILGQWERMIIGDRVSENMHQRAKDGKWNGGPVPFGYFKKDKHILINPKEATLLRTIYDKYLETASLRAVTHWLNSNDYRTREGATWATSSIRRLLTNPTYIGKIWYSKRMSTKSGHKMKNRPKEEWIIVKGNHEAIIDEEIFNSIQKVIKSQGKTPVRVGSEYLLSGLVRCGKCDASMNGYSQRLFRCKQLKTYAYYKCHNATSKGKSVCKGNTIGKDMLEKLVIDKILSFANSEEFKISAKKSLDAFNKLVEDNRDPLEKEKMLLEKDNASVKTRKKTLLERLEDGTIDKDTYRGRIAELEKQSEDNKNRLLAIDVELSDVGAEIVSLDAVTNIIDNFQTNWKHLDYIGKRNLLLALISKITVVDKSIKVDLYFLSELMVRACPRMDRGS